jgi:hypothetical protein
MIYITDDGSFGGAEGMVLVDTTEWTEADYLKLEEASDMERLDIAREIAQTYNAVRYGQLWQVKDGVIQNG